MRLLPRTLSKQGSCSMQNNHITVRKTIGEDKIIQSNPIQSNTREQLTDLSESSICSQMAGPEALDSIPNSVEGDEPFASFSIFDLAVINAVARERDGTSQILSTILEDENHLANPLFCRVSTVLSRNTSSSFFFSPTAFWSNSPIKKLKCP